MTKPNGHLNGHGNGHGDGDGKVHSLDEARRRAAQKAKAQSKAAPSAGRPNTARDWIFGGVMLAMAVAGLASFFMDMTGGAAVPGTTVGGMQ
jgi:hypothetical protein